MVRRGKAVLLAGFLGLLVAIALLVRTTPATTSGSERVGPARIVFEHSSWSFGAVWQGEIVEHLFPFRNAGGETLIISDVHASCGCTASGAQSDRIAPGETGAIYARFDSNGKLGQILKTITVTSNDSASPTTTLSIIVDVKLDTRVKPDTVALEDTSRPGVMKVMAMIDRSKGRSIFDEACRSCHVDPAIGKRGADLYEGACAICHGSADHPVISGAVGITSSGYLKRRTRNFLREKTARGTASPMMPGFSVNHGGPLKPEEIESLMDWFDAIRDSVPVHSTPRFNHPPA